MQRYEYRVIPAPRRGVKAKGLKTTEERFALALANLMNDLGHEGWDYIRADALPVEERSGFTGTKTIYQTMLVFRRPLAELGSEKSSASGTRQATLALPSDAGQDTAPLRLGSVTAAEGQTPELGPALGSASAGLHASIRG